MHYKCLWNAPTLYGGLNGENIKHFKYKKHFFICKNDGHFKCDRKRQVS